MTVFKIQHTIDIDALKDVIENAGNLNDNEAMFAELSKVTKAKNELKSTLEELEKYEAGAKNLIRQRATTLYGHDWQTIVGKGYKITRSFTGSVFVRNPDIPVSKKFIEIKESLKTKVIEEELDKTGKLPKGIEVNPSRGESIRITIK